jgi:hypothetical protein
MDKKNLRIEVEYRNMWVLAIILFMLSILFPIVSVIVVYQFKWKISVFWALPLVHLWWFVPSQVGYLPFFSRKLLNYPRLMKRVFWLMFIWPLLIMILIGLDYSSNLWVTRALVSTVPTSFSSIIALAITLLPLIVNKLSSSFLNKVNVEVLWSTLKRVIAPGFGEKGYASPEVLRKGLPIVIANGGKKAVLVSHILLGIATSNVPLGFKTKSGRTPITYEEQWTLPKWVMVKSKSSEILYIPWKKVVNALLKAQEIIQKLGKDPRLYIGAYDPFSNERFWSKQVDHQTVWGDFSYLKWLKQHPDWRKE